MKNLVLIIVVFAIFSCNSSKKPNNKQDITEDTLTYKLELIWKSDTTVRTPESVLIDRTRNILYVSCINENPWEKDGNGFITKMDKLGKIIDLKWIEGLDAPKGMSISGNSLFIADINTLVEANIESGEIINKIELEGKPDLNDITVSDDGTVYVSGSGSNTIYKLTSGSLEPIFTGEEGERFNGLFWEKDRMLLITSASSKFIEIPWASMQAKTISENMGHGDAIAPVGDGCYLTTSWTGAVNYVSAEGKVTQLLNTVDLGENAADADFCIEDQMMYLPTFFKNQVKAYKLVKK
jgi:outer membrane protein assembly factor BamB